MTLTTVLDRLPTQRLLDPGVHPFTVAVDALGVDLQQHVDGVPGTIGHVGSGYARVQPQRPPGMAKVVRTSGERGGHPVGRQRQASSLVPDPAVRRRGDDVAACAAKQATGLVDAEPVKMLAQDGDELRGDRHVAGFLDRPVFQPSFHALFSTLAQRRGFREYLTGLLAPRDRNKTVTCLPGAEPV